MENYNSKSNTYYYPRTRRGNIKINHIVDFTPDKYKSTYHFRTIDGRPSDAFYFKPSGNSKEKKMSKYNYKNSEAYIFPGNNGNQLIKEIHKTVYEPHKFNENGIIREKRNYTLYENKNWTENISYPIVEYEKIDLPPPPAKPKPKPKPKKIYEKSVEIFKEEIEREEDRNKKYLKSNFIRTRDGIKSKKFKYKGMYKCKADKKNYNYNYMRNSDNIITIYDCKNVDNNNTLNNEGGENEIKKIKKLTEKKQINDNNYTDTITTKKEYKFHKTSTITVPIKK